MSMPIAEKEMTVAYGKTLDFTNYRRDANFKILKLRDAISHLSDGPKLLKSDNRKCLYEDIEQ